MTLRQLLPYVGLGVVSLALAGWWMLPDDAPETAAKAHKSARVAVEAPAAADAPKKRPGPAAKRAAEPGPQPESELATRLRDLDPEDRRDLRDVVREEQWEETETRLYDYAATVGWDDETTAEIRGILEETTMGVSKRLRRVDAGKATWDDLRPELREFRLEQADKLRDKLGDDGFLEFAEGMDFWRYNGGSRPGRPMGKHLAGQEE